MTSEEPATPPAPGRRPAVLDRAAVQAEMESARLDFHRLMADATPADLHRPTNGTRWTNQQLLFHMLLGYLIMRPLIMLAGMFARMPASTSQEFARLLDAVTGPFHWVNYLGSCAGAKIFPARRMAGKMDRVTMGLERRLRAETSARLCSGMHYPVRWGSVLQGLHDPG